MIESYRKVTAWYFAWISQKKYEKTGEGRIWGIGVERNESLVRKYMGAVQ